MSKHTQEPWKSEGGVVYQGRHGGFDLLCGPNPESDARRIVACVNACVGVSNGELAMTTMSVVLARMSYAEQQRDELLAALEHILRGALSLPRFAEEQARAAIAKAKGGAA